MCNHQKETLGKQIAKALTFFLKLLFDTTTTTTTGIGVFRFGKQSHDFVNDMSNGTSDNKVCEYFLYHFLKQTT